VDRRAPCQGEGKYKGSRNRPLAVLKSEERIGETGPSGLFARKTKFLAMFTTHQVLSLGAWCNLKKNVKECTVTQCSSNTVQEKLPNRLHVLEGCVHADVSL
jgi:hypothetical protein